MAFKGTVDAPGFKMLPQSEQERLTEIIEGERGNRNNYISTMKNAIESYNPNANVAAAEALAWGGLQETTVWKIKSDTTNILNINWNSRDASLNKYSQYNFQKCGNIPVQ